MSASAAEEKRVRPTKRAGLGVAAGSAAVAAVAVASGAMKPQPGPLEGPPPSGFAMRQDVGHVFTDGSLVVRHRTGRPITLVSVEPVLRGDGLDYLGGFVAAPTAGTVQYLPTFPPRDDSLGALRPVEGAVLTAQGDDARGYELLLGFRVTSSGRTTRPAVRLVYEQGGQRYQQDFPATLAVCAPLEGPDCEQEFDTR